MRNFTTELKVGIFSIIVIFFLTYMTFKVGSMPQIWEKGYRLYVVIDDINGLDEKSRIKIAGVDAGIVDRIWLENGKAKISLLLNPDVIMYGNAEVSLKMSGLLGDRYMALTTGTPDQPPLKDGDTITGVAPAADIDALANKLSAAAGHVGDLTRNINTVFGEEEKQALREAIFNLRTLTETLRDISQENREPLRNILARLEGFSRTLDEKGPGVIDDLSTASNELKEVIAENREALSQSIENIRTVSESASNIVRKVENGEGTLGKLVTEDKLYNSLDKITNEAGKALDFSGRLRTFMEFRTDYNTGDDEWKGYFNLTLQPSSDKYYIIGVVDDEKGAVKTTDIVRDGVHTVEKETVSAIEFTAQVAKRYENVALRIGMTENTFGFGSDYFFNNDDGRVNFDIWDFNALEAEAENAHAKIGVDYKVFKYFFVSAGVDNLLNSGRRGVYAGGGFKFEDTDFKYLLGSAPRMPLP